MTKRRHSRIRVLSVILIVLIGLLGIGTGLFLLDGRVDAPKARTVAAKPAAPAKTAPVPAPAQPAPSFDKTQFSTTDPASLWVIVNKQHPLNPIDYAPADLVTAYGHQVSSRLVPDLSAMINDAANSGVDLTIISSYRSYAYQVSLYGSYVAHDGQSQADTYSARPGYSEHQTGLAIDFGDKAGTCPVEQCYGDTNEGRWLASNSYQYGFILRYTAADQAVTGYEAEPWHYRYVGRALAGEMHAENVATLEQFFGVSGGQNYN